MPRAPQRLEVVHVAQRVHRLPEALVPVGHQLAVRGEPLERAALPERLVVGNEIEHVGREDEEAAVDPALADLRLLLELDDRVALAAEGRRIGRAAAPR